MSRPGTVPILLVVVLILIGLGAMARLRGAPGVLRAADLPPMLVVMAVDGLSWPVLSPALSRGVAPTFARIASYQRGTLAARRDQPRAMFWDALVRVRTAPGRLLAEQLARAGGIAGGMVCAIEWEGNPQMQFFPPGVLPPEAIPPLTTYPHLSPALAVRTAHDRGVLNAAAALIGTGRFRHLLLRLGGPYDPDFSDPGVRALSPPDAYWNDIEASLHRFAESLPAHAMLIVAGHGIGAEGGPAEDGVWLARGPRLARGPLREPLPVSSLVPTLLQLAEVALPIGCAAEPDDMVMDPTWAREHPARWEPVL